jgi:hypothetical protein
MLALTSWQLPYVQSDRREHSSHEPSACLIHLIGGFLQRAARLAIAFIPISSMELEEIATLAFFAFFAARFFAFLTITILHLKVHLKGSDPIVQARF